MRLATALLTLVYASVLAAIGFAFFLSGLNPMGASLSLLIGVLAGGLAWWRTESWPSPPIRLWDGLMLGAFALASLRAFLWLIYTRGDAVCVLSPNNLGDMSLHLNFIRYFASGVPFWPESPMLTGVPLAYPVGADLFNSLFESFGFDTYRTLIWTGLGGAALTGFLLWRWGGNFGLAALLFNGGLAGFVFLRTLKLDDYQTELIWKNFFLSMFVTQRGLLVALPAGLLLLTVWRERYFRSGRRILPFPLELLLYVGIPLFNFHTFLFLSLTLFAIFLARPAARKELLIFVGTALIPGTLCVLLITACLLVSHIPDPWHGIMEGKAFVDWVTDFGLTLPLALAAGILLIRDRDTEARCFVWTAIVVFIICCVRKFAPWSWDNMKLVLWAWLALAPYLWLKVIKPLHVSARVALCLALFFSGFISLLGGLDGRHGYDIAHRSDLVRWQAALRSIPPTARFATVSDFNNPIFLLGRKVVCDYTGHLWSHGLDYEDKFNRLQRVLNQEPGWEDEALDLGADYVVFRKDSDWQKPPEIFDIRGSESPPPKP
ncbi:hypothetical protein BH09VER1_BH09VER1_31420 [soil metagenome]